MAVRRTTTAIARRVASGGRRAGALVRRAGTRVVTVVRSPRARRVGRALVQGGSAVALAQARIIPGALGGLIIGKVERDQRMREAGPDRGGKAGTPMIKDPLTRIVAEMAGLAFAASKLTGIAREVAIGAAGGLGAIYESYTAETGNPDDNYIAEVKAGRAGI